jgi:hypothetical protein
MNRQSEGRYDTLSAQGKDFQFEGEESKRSFKQQLLSHTMYRSDIRARETIEYSAMELNLDNVTNQGTEFNPKQLARIRTNFDAVAAGRYEKKLEPKVMRYVETQADAAYRKETNSKEADRNSTLWKTLRNVELLKGQFNLASFFLARQFPKRFGYGLDGLLQQRNRKFGIGFKGDRELTLGGEGDEIKLDIGHSAIRIGLHQDISGDGLSEKAARLLVLRRICNTEKVEAGIFR